MPPKDRRNDFVVQATILAIGVVGKLGLSLNERRIAQRDKEDERLMQVDSLSPKEHELYLKVKDASKDEQKKLLKTLEPARQFVIISRVLHDETKSDDGTLSAFALTELLALEALSRSELRKALRFYYKGRLVHEAAKIIRRECTDIYPLVVQEALGKNPSIEKQEIADELTRRAQAISMIKRDHELIREWHSLDSATNDRLYQQGNGAKAEQLQHLMAEIAEKMSSLPSGETPSTRKFKDSSQFFAEVLQCIEAYQGAQEPVYQFFAANLAKLNSNLLEVIPVIVDILLADTNRDRQVYIAGVIGIFGSLIAQFPLGQRAINLELAIVAFQQVLKVMSREGMPVVWAETMNNLANAYADRIHGDRAQNIEEAIAAHQQALQVRTRESSPISWAGSMHNLATAYYHRIHEGRAQNIEKAIAAYQQALQVTTRDDMPFEWAETMNNLAIAYRDRVHEDRAQNIEKAIVICQQALQERSREDTPLKWAETMSNLASAYYFRIYGERALNIEKAK